MTQNIQNQTKAGLSSAHITDAHAVVDSCYHTQGYVENRETSCVICLEEMESSDRTITHCECQNAFHEACFDGLVDTDRDFFYKTAKEIKCPMCRGIMRPWPVLGCENSTEARGKLHAKRIECLRRRVEAEGGLAPAARELANIRAEAQAQMAPHVPVHIQLEEFLGGPGTEALRAAVQADSREVFLLRMTDLTRHLAASPPPPENRRHIRMPAEMQNAYREAIQEIRDELNMLQLSREPTRPLPTAEQIRDADAQDLPVDSVVARLGWDHLPESEQALLRPLIGTVIEHAQWVLGGEHPLLETLRVWWNAGLI